MSVTKAEVARLTAEISAMQKQMDKIHTSMHDKALELKRKKTQLHNEVRALERKAEKTASSAT